MPQVDFPLPQFLVRSHFTRSLRKLALFPNNGKWKEGVGICACCETAMAGHGLHLQPRYFEVSRGIPKHTLMIRDTVTWLLEHCFELQWMDESYTT